MLRSPHHAILRTLAPLFGVVALVFFAIEMAPIGLPFAGISVASLALLVVMRLWRQSTVVGLIALILFGGWATHRFYLGYRRSGWIMLASLAAVIVLLFSDPPPPGQQPLWAVVIVLGASALQVLTLSRLAPISVDPLGVIWSRSDNPHDATAILATALAIALQVWLIADFVWLCWRLVRPIWHKPPPPAA